MTYSLWREYSATSCWSSPRGLYSPHPTHCPCECIKNPNLYWRFARFWKLCCAVASHCAPLVTHKRYSTFRQSTLISSRMKCFLSTVTTNIKSFYFYRMRLWKVHNCSVCVCARVYTVAFKCCGGEGWKSGSMGQGLDYLGRPLKVSLRYLGRPF